METQFEDLVIALNASPLLSRDATCRLSVAPEVWLGSRQPPDLAAELEVSAKCIRYARECARTAHHLAGREKSRARNLGAKIVTRHSPDYPRTLLDLELPPPALYVLGALEDRHAIAVVGSRKADPYGIEVAERLSGELAARRLVIVSGLALGVDSAAHRAALAVGGTTIAVLGCGLDVDYPRSNRHLRAEIAESGALVSEFPIGTRPEPYHFPIRNRIIAALGLGTLVVRGTPKSGSLITAGCALALGRAVWAVPGNIFDPKSQGPNSLIRDGAHPIQSTADLLETLPVGVQVDLESTPDTASLQPNRTDLAQVYRAIPAGETADASALVETTGVGLDRVLGLLLELEITGFLKRYPGPVWGHTGVVPSEPCDGAKTAARE